MLKSYKSSLNLNSYKLDTRGYQEKIKQLIEQAGQIKSQLYQSKSKENQLYQELRNTKLEVNTLRNMMKSEFVVHENKCKNCATFSKQSIDKLIAELEAEKDKAGSFKKMYDNQVENKKQLAEYYQKKLRNIMRDKDLLAKKYEEKVMYLSNNNGSFAQTFDSSTSIQNHLPPAFKTQQEIPLAKPIDKEKRNYPPPSPKLNSPRHNQSQKKAIQSSNKEIINTLLLPIVQKLNKMQINFSEMRTIPQIQRFSQAANPPKNRFIKLLRDFPFECEDDDLIEQCHQQIVQYLQYKGLENSGENILNFLIKKMEQL